MAVIQGNSRVGNASRVAVGTENTNYTLPDNSVEYVYAASIEFTGGDRNDAGDSVTLQFRTGADAFATLTNTGGAVRTGTVLTDQNAVAVGERLTTGGVVYNPGTEIEGTNSVGTMLDRTQASVTECQWSLDFSNAAADTTYDFQVVWAHKSGTSTFQYLSITTAAAAGPTLTLPTEANIGQTTVTVGCTTDTAAGTLYYYISTSATPPTAANLKAGTGAVKFGNVTSPGVGTETFNVTGLNNNTTYYTYFIHNDGANDSNILESGSWSTLPPATDSETFTVNNDVTIANTMDADLSHTMTVNPDLNLSNVKTTSEAITYLANLAEQQVIQFDVALALILQVAQQEQNNKTIPLSVNLDKTMNYLFQNVLTGTKTISFDTLMTEVFDNSKTTQESILFSINMDEQQSTSVTGSVAFGLVNTYLTSNTKSISEQLSANIILDQAEQVSKLLSETQTFSFNLTFASTPFGAGILDDPFYGSPDNYIFVDLANIVIGASGIVTGSITFTTDMGETHTVAMIGAAAEQFVLQLAQQELAVKNTTESVTYTAQFAEAIALAQLVDFTASVNMSMVPTNTATIVRNILFDISNTLDATNVKDVTETFSFDSILDATQVAQLIAGLNISLDVNMDQAQTVQADFNKAITYLTNLNYLFTTGATENVTFDLSMLQTEAVRQILNPTITMLANLSQTEQKQLVTSESISFLTNLQQQQDAFVGILAAIEFAAQLNQTEVGGLTINEAFNLIINMADNVNVQLDKLETISLLLQLADSYAKDRIIPISTNFLANLNFTSTKLLDKLGSMVFATVLQQVESGQVDFNALVTFSAIMSEFMVGDAAGTISGFITFATTMLQNNVGISTLNDSIAFNSILDLIGIGGLDLADSISLIANLGQDVTIDLTQEGFVEFQAYFNKLIEPRMDYRPSIDFDLQAIETSAATKNTLASMILGIENNLIVDGNRTIPAVVNYALSQNFDTEIRLVAEGTVTMTAQMQESTALQTLGLAGITFGHLLGLSVLSGAGRSESISFGTVTSLSTDGFVLQFEVVTPDGRTFKVYFEDRITIVDEENRVIKVYKQPDFTIN